MVKLALPAEKTSIGCKCSVLLDLAVLSLASARLWRRENVVPTTFPGEEEPGILPGHVAGPVSGPTLDNTPTGKGQPPPAGARAADEARGAFLEVGGEDGGSHGHQQRCCRRKAASPMSPTTTGRSSAMGNARTARSGLIGTKKRTSNGMADRAKRRKKSRMPPLYHNRLTM